MKNPAVNIATYRKLVKFGNASGSPGLIGTVIGTVDGEVIQSYLSEMKSKDAALYKQWGSKWKPEEDDDDIEDPATTLEDDDIDPTADLEDEPPPPPAKKEATVGLDDLFATPVSTAKNNVQVGIDREGNGFALAAGTSTSIPESFRLRNPDGTTTILEVFSRSAKYGYIVRVPVVTDMRTVTVAGQPAEVDLLELRRDPDGMTEINGKRIGNSKLIAVIELSD